MEDVMDACEDEAEVVEVCDADTEVPVIGAFLSIDRVVADGELEDDEE